MTQNLGHQLTLTVSLVFLLVFFFLLILLFLLLSRFRTGITPRLVVVAVTVVATSRAGYVFVIRAVRRLGVGAVVARRR